MFKGQFFAKLLSYKIQQELHFIVIKKIGYSDAPRLVDRKLCWLPMAENTGYSSSIIAIANALKLRPSVLRSELASLTF